MAKTGLAAYQRELARLLATHEWVNIASVMRDGKYVYLSLNGVRYA